MNALIINRFGTLGVEEIDDCPVIGHLSELFKFINYEDREHMTGDFDTPIIGIDRGASFSDFAIIDSGRLIETFSLENRSWKAISSAFARLNRKYQTENREKCSYESELFRCRLPHRHRLRRGC